MGLKTGGSRLGRGGGLDRSRLNVPVLFDVADAPTRLALTDIPIGYQVHQVDNNTVYQYNGGDITSELSWAAVP